MLLPPINWQIFAANLKINWLTAVCRCCCRRNVKLIDCRCCSRRNVKMIDCRCCSRQNVKLIDCRVLQPPTCEVDWLQGFAATEMWNWLNGGAAAFEDNLFDCRCCCCRNVILIDSLCGRNMKIIDWLQVLLPPKDLQFKLDAEAGNKTKILEQVRICSRANKIKYQVVVRSRNRPLFFSWCRR